MKRTKTKSKSPHLSENPPPGLCRNWHLWMGADRRRIRMRMTHSIQGCRGFTGPFPPPLWMSASQYIVVYGNSKLLTFPMLPEATVGLEPTVGVLQTPALTTWLRRPIKCGSLAHGQGTGPERKTRFELATLSLARRCSTTEPLPHVGGLDPPRCRSPDLNWGHLDFQSSALPTELPRHTFDAKNYSMSTSGCQVLPFRGQGIIMRARTAMTETSTLVRPSREPTGGASGHVRTGGKSLPSRRVNGPASGRQ
jgi:hypothetical protein